MIQAKISRNYDDKSRYGILILRKDNLLNHGACVLFFFFKVIFQNTFYYCSHYFFNFIFLTPKTFCIEL